MSFRTGVFATLLFAAAALPAWAADYYVAPLGAAPVSNPDGSKSRPFGSIGAALSSGKIVGGDTILLMDGSHGGVVIKSGFEQPVTIRSETPKGAHVESVHFDGTARNITLKDLRVWRKEGDGAWYLIRSWPDAKGIGVEDLDIRSRENATNYLNWDFTRWKTVADEGANGVDLRGHNNTVRNTTIVGVRYGIMVGPGSVVENNVVEGFTADGLRGCTDTVFRNNLIRNVISLSDDVHRDGMQCYRPSTTTNLRVIGNTIIDWAEPNRDHPMRGTLMGISLFDGFYDNIEIVNNVVATTHYNGIAVYGTRGARIVNNTVVNSAGEKVGNPWITVRSTKAGEPSQNVLVANNLAMKISGSSDAALGNLFTDNRVILDPAAVFEDLSQWNFRPKASSGFLDVANVAYAPLTDRLGNARPSGAGPDLGAYEVGASGGAVVEEPTTGGTAPATDPVATDGTISDTTTEPILTTDTSDGLTPETPGTTTEPAPTTGTTSPTDSGTTDTSSGTDTTTTTDTTTDTTTTTTPGRSAGKWSKPLRKK